MAFSIVFYVGYLVFIPVKYFEVNGDFKIMNKDKVVKIGGDLVYLVDYCKYKNYIPIKVVRSLVDGYVYDLPIQTASTFPFGCRKIEVSVPMIVPSTMPTNHKYHMQIAIDYQINPFKTENRIFSTEEFTLIQ